MGKKNKEKGEERTEEEVITGDLQSSFIFTSSVLFFRPVEGGKVGKDGRFHHRFLRDSFIRRKERSKSRYLKRLRHRRRVQKFFKPPEFVFISSSTPEKNFAIVTLITLLAFFSLFFKKILRYFVCYS